MIPARKRALTTVTHATPGFFVRNQELSDALSPRETGTVSEAQCRKNADECMEWARAAQTDEERNKFLDMAENWLQSAIGASLRNAFGGALTKQNGNENPVAA